MQISLVHDSLNFQIKVNYVRILTEHETLEMLRIWKMDQLKEWLLTWGLKRSGKKEVLVKRVYRVMQSGDDSSSDSASESDLDDTPCVTPINDDVLRRCLHAHDTHPPLRKSYCTRINLLNGQISPKKLVHIYSV